MHGPVPRLISRLQWGLNPPTADLTPAQISISISQLLQHPLGRVSEKAFQELYVPIWRCAPGRGRNYHADCPVPPRCYGAPPKCGLNQSMAPFFGSHCGTPAGHKMVPPATSTPSAKAAKFAAHVACSQYGRVVNAHHLLPPFRNCYYFRCFHQN